MSHTFTNLLLGGIARELRGTALIVNGTADHVHLLVKLPADLAIADCVRVLKTNSSRWIHERHAFAWQTGYGAFTVSSSAAGKVLKYIRDQEQHHRKVSFRDEFLGFLKKQQIDFDERFVFD